MIEEMITAETIRMIGLGDNIGSGFRKILHAWKELGYEHPSIKEESDVNEVWLTLPLVQGYGSVTDRVKAVTEPTINVIDRAKDVTEPTINVIDRAKDVTEPTINVIDRAKDVTESTVNVTGRAKDVTESTVNSSMDVTESAGAITDNGSDIINYATERTNGKEGPTKRRGVILDRMRKDPSVTLEKLADQLGVTRRTISRDIESLTKMKLLRRDGGDFGGKWIVI